MTKDILSSRDSFILRIWLVVVAAVVLFAALDALFSGPVKEEIQLVSAGYRIFLSAVFCIVSFLLIFFIFFNTKRDGQTPKFFKVSDPIYATIMFLIGAFMCLDLGLGLLFLKNSLLFRFLQ